MWDEVKKAKDENRRELVLTGNVLTDRMKSNKGLLDPEIFQLANLNFLDLSSCAAIVSIPTEIIQLQDLTTLLMNNNGIGTMPVGELNQLKKLKVLNLSGNQITEGLELNLPNLTSLNLSLNKMNKMANLEKCTSLSHLEMTGNALTSMEFACATSLNLLADVQLSRNQITEIPSQISNLVSLKKFDLADNQVKSVPGELADCTRIKELALGNNPLSDNRLKKMVAQKGAKAVLDYIRSNCPKTGGAASGGVSGGGGGKKKGKKNKGGSAAASQAEELEVDELCNIIEVTHLNDDNPKIVVHDEVKDVRPFVVACVVKNLDLSGDNFKKFIQLQTKLHDSVCEKRQAATIATHDLAKIASGDITYTAKKPTDIKIIPLNQNKEFDGKTLVGHLKEEAENYRKEKKRNTLSGIHQYLNMLSKKDMYACFQDAQGNVISFPPITNSDVSKITEKTEAILLEVTSELKLQTVKDVADKVIEEMLNAGLGKTLDGSDEKSTLYVEQLKVVDAEGNMKVVYPSKTDLQKVEIGSKIRVRRI